MPKPSGQPQRVPPRRPPTRIARKPVREQMPLTLEMKPRQRLAQRRRRFRLIMLSISVIGCAVFIAGLGALSYHSRFTIADVRVEGAHELEPQTVAATVRAYLNDGAFRLFSRANIFLFPRDGITAELERSFPRIKELSVRRESMLSQAVIVAIEERVAANTWCDETCYLMDEDGLIYDQARESVGYVFRGGLLPGDPIGQRLLIGRLDDIATMLAELGRIGFSPVSIAIENEADYSVFLGTGYHLKLGFDSETRAVVRTLQLLRSDRALEESDALEYIDLRFGNRVYVKKKGEGQPEAALPGIDGSDETH